MSYEIDWDNLPICGEPPVLVISPYICQVGDSEYVPPDGGDKCLRQRDVFTGTPSNSDCGVTPTPATPVPIPATLGLLIIGIAAMKWARRRK